MVTRRRHCSTHSGYCRHMKSGASRSSSPYPAPTRYGQGQRPEVARTKNEASMGDASFYLVIKPPDCRQVSPITYDYCAIPIVRLQQSRYLAAQAPLFSAWLFGSERQHGELDRPRARSSPRCLPLVSPETYPEQATITCPLPDGSLTCSARRRCRRRAGRARPASTGRRCSFAR